MTNQAMALTSEAQSTFNDWNQALNDAEAAERAVKVALRAGLFTSDPGTLKRLVEIAIGRREIADRKLDAAVAALFATT